MMLYLISQYLETLSSCWMPSSKVKCIQFGYHWLTLLSALVCKMKSFAETFPPPAPERHHPELALLV